MVVLNASENVLHSFGNCSNLALEKSCKYFLKEFVIFIQRIKFFYSEMAT